MRPVVRFAHTLGTNLPERAVNGPPRVRIGLLKIIDPAGGSRAVIATEIVRQAAAAAAQSKEAALRDAMARAYALRLSVSELQALDRFLATPEGVAFAGTSATLDNDLGMFAARQLMDEAVVAAVPAMTRRIDDATRSLPKVKGWADLNETERQEAAKLLNLDPRQVRQ